MSAVEEIEAARTKLTKLRDDSSVGVWYQSMVGISSKTETMGRYSVVGDVDDDDTALIVTLHRTIDAQITILNATIEDEHADWLTEMEWQNALALARAINGTA